MDWSGLFMPVANYLNFLLDLVVLEIPIGLQGLGRIDGTLLLYLSLSIAMAMAIQKQPIPPDLTSEPDEDRKPASKDLPSQQDLLVYFPSILFGGLGMHLGLFGWSQLSELSIGNYRDTFNAILLASCINYPLLAILGVCNRRADPDNPRQLTALLGLYMVSIVVMFFYIGVFTADVHGLPWSALWVPMGLWLAVLVLIGFVFQRTERFLKHNPNTLEDLSV